MYGHTAIHRGHTVYGDDRTMHNSHNRDYRKRKPSFPSFTAKAFLTILIHTGMEVEHPVFGCCPFAGVYCRFCKTRITAEGTPTQSRNMTKHLQAPNHLTNCDVPIKKDTLPLRAFVDSAKKKLLPFAKALVEAWMMEKDADDARLVLAEFLMPAAFFSHCPFCDKYAIKENHDSSHQGAMVEKLGYCAKVVCAGGSNRITGCRNRTIVPGYNPYDFSNKKIYSRLFRDLLDSEVLKRKYDGYLVAETERLPEAKRAKNNATTYNRS